MQVNIPGPGFWAEAMDTMWKGSPSFPLISGQAQSPHSPLLQPCPPALCHSSPTAFSLPLPSSNTSASDVCGVFALAVHLPGKLFHGGPLRDWP